MRSVAELAWAAGFFDGEGHSGNHSGGAHARLGEIRAEIVQANDEELLRFQEAVGFGLVRGPFHKTQRSGFRKPQWRYRAHGFEKVQALACVLWPYLCSTKREQFRRALIHHREERA